MSADSASDKNVWVVSHGGRLGFNSTGTTSCGARAVVVIDK